MKNFKKIYSNFSQTSLIGCFLIFFSAISQSQNISQMDTRQQLLEKIRKGELVVTPEMVKQGEALKSANKKKDPATLNKDTVSETKSEDTVVSETKSSRDAFLADSISNLTSEEAYGRLSKAGLEELKLRLFGFEIFRQSLPQSPSSLPPMDEYIIAQGDEIVVYTWGRENATRNIYVDKDGFFNYPPLSPIRVAGLSFGEAKTAIKSSLESISGLQAKVSLGQLSSIRVLILGDVEKPGSYFVNSGTTLINALFACGGIKEIGSLRGVRLERGGRTLRTVDLYRLLLEGASAGDIQLLSGDILFVPVIQRKVAVAGAVRRPAIYEAKTGEKVGDLIRYAGGLNPDADGGRIVVERVRQNERRVVLNVKFEPKSGKIPDDITVEDGDLIKVFPLMSGETNSVVVTGHVFAPGKYEFKQGMTLKALLPDLSAYRPEPFLDYAMVKRSTAPDYHPEYVPISLRKVYLEDADFPLEPRDTLFIFSRAELLDTLVIVVEGNVRKPGRIPYVRNMRVSDAIVAAGGFKEETHLTEVQVLKYDPDPSKTVIKKTDMTKVLADYQAEENWPLSPNDKVVVFALTTFHLPDSVGIEGEIKRPGHFPLAMGMTVSDLVKQAGGYTQATYKLYVEIIRTEIENDSIEREKVIKLNFSQDPGEKIDFRLQKRDEVYIRNIVDYGKVISVKLNGLFLFPGIYQAEKGEKLSSVITRAGGFRKDAFLPGLIFTRKRVRESQQENLKIVAEKMQKQLESMLTQDAAGASAEDIAYRDMLIRQRMTMVEDLRSSTPLGRVILRIKDFEQFKGAELDIAVEDGDELTVTENLNTVSIMGEVFAPISVVYWKATNTIGECLNLAGGVTDNGDEDNIYLVRADGTIVTPKTIGFFTVFNWIEVGPGATIIVPPKTPKKGFWAELEQVTRVIYQLAVTTGVVVTVLKP